VRCKRHFDLIQYFVFQPQDEKHFQSSVGMFGYLRQPFHHFQRDRSIQVNVWREVANKHFEMKKTIKKMNARDVFSSEKDPSCFLFLHKTNAKSCHKVPL
jgi:hypothetical protein